MYAAGEEVWTMTRACPFECLYEKVSWKPPGNSGTRTRATSLIFDVSGSPVTSHTIAPKSTSGPPRARSGVRTVRLSPDRPGVKQQAHRSEPYESSAHGTSE